jgi:hypothetical protein
MSKKYWLICALLCILGFTMKMEATEVLIQKLTGESALIEVDLDAVLQQHMEDLGILDASLHRVSLVVEEIDSPESEYTNDKESNDQYTGFRFYDQLVSNPERQDIHFIIVTLANKSLVSLLNYKKPLEDAGKRVNHVHPLRFLESIFADEEMKVAMHNVRKRGWVWDDFFKGLAGSLGEESNQNNMTTHMVLDFCTNLEISSTEILPLVNMHQWKELIDALIRLVPRKGDFDHYDM